MNLVIELTNDQMERLSERARSLNTTAQELASQCLRNLIDQPAHKDMNEVFEYVLKKNRELYKRLA